tara:strand:- start:1164 stop:1649 length:486 start_codon:yes stop_codon:yes gene_type:complete
VDLGGYFLKKDCKMIRVLVLIAAVMCAGGSLFADTIGYVDMESIFANAKMVKHFQENMKEKQADYQEFFEKKQKKLEKAKKKGKSDEEMKELITELENEILPKRQELSQLEAGFQQNLLLSIKRTSKEIASELGVDVVVDNRVVFYGGLDMTDLVLDQLNQ